MQCQKSVKTTCQQHHHAHNISVTVLTEWHSVCLGWTMLAYATCLCGIEFGLTSTDETVPGRSFVKVLVHADLGWWGQEISESSERCWFQVGFVDVSALNM